MDIRMLDLLDKLRCRLATLQAPKSTLWQKMHKIHHFANDSSPQENWSKWQLPKLEELVL